MNDCDRARGGRFREVSYFNGGLFAVIELIKLHGYELRLIGNDEATEMQGAAEED